MMARQVPHGVLFYYFRATIHHNGKVEDVKTDCKSGSTSGVVGHRISMTSLENFIKWLQVLPCCMHWMLGNQEASSWKKVWNQTIELGDCLCDKEMKPH